MSDILQSILVSTAALTVAALFALALTVLRLPKSFDHVALRRVGIFAAVAVAAQACHFIEELVTGFYEAFPTTLGLVPLPRSFFVIFNVGWLLVWLLSLPGLTRGFRPAFFPIWFLAMALALNGLAHPMLALQGGAYFPGLITAPLVGLLGICLFLLLWRATVPNHIAAGA